MTAPEPARLARCHYLLPVKAGGWLTVEASGQCTAPAADPAAEVLLCSAHLAGVLRALVAGGVVHEAARCDAEARRDQMVADLLAGRP